MKSRRARKTYPIHQSPLYKLRGKGQFSKLLGIEWDLVDKIITDENYRVWANEFGREIQAPISKLEKLHRRLGKLLSHIELPEYVYSQRGRSYSDNARVHVNTYPLIKTDIHKFFPSTTWHMVYRAFTEDFQCAADVANKLTNICCYKQSHVPTGSTISGRISFFAAKHMFDEIALLAESQGCVMSLYVDDITLSGEKATKKLLGEVRKIIHRHGYKAKDRKSSTYSPYSAKPVTGTIIAGDTLRLPNDRHRKILETRKQLASASGDNKDDLIKSLRGRLQEAKQIIGE